MDHELVEGSSSCRPVLQIKDGVRLAADQLAAEEENEMLFQQ